MTADDRDHAEATRVGRPCLWVLLVGDPTTGAATRPVGVLGVAGEDCHVAWLPLEPATAPWRERLAAPSDVPIAEQVAFWAEHANGLTLDLTLIQLDAEAGGLRDAVEEAVDELLATTAGL